MALYYRSNQSCTKVIDEPLDPADQTATWMSYQLTDWVSKIGPSYAKMLNYHETWVDDTNTYSPTSTPIIQIEFRGANYRAGNDAPYLRHGFEMSMQGTSTSYHYDRMVVFNENKVSSSTGAYYSRAREVSIQSDAYQYRAADYANKRLLCVLYSDTPGQRFFAYYIYGLGGIFYEMNDIADFPDEIDPGWLHIRPNSSITPLTRYQSGSTQKYYFHQTRPFMSTDNRANYDAVGVSNTSGYRPILDRWDIPNNYGQYMGMAEGTLAYSQYSLPQWWQYNLNEKTYISWSNYNLIDITGLNDG